MIYPSIAIFRRYASILLVGTCFIFSSIKVRYSSVIRSLICIFLFLFSIGKIPFRFHRGFGILPNKQNLYLRNCGKKRFFTERVPLSYACYSSYSLISTTTESCFLPTFIQEYVFDLQIKFLILFAFVISSIIGYL